MITQVLNGITMKSDGNDTEFTDKEIINGLALMLEKLAETVRTYKDILTLSQALDTIFAKVLGIPYVPKGLAVAAIVKTYNIVRGADEKD
jgi:hypothetical protein